MRRWVLLCLRKPSHQDCDLRSVQTHMKSRPSNLQIQRHNKERMIHSFIIYIYGLRSLISRLLAQNGFTISFRSQDGCLCLKQSCHSHTGHMLQQKPDQNEDSTYQLSTSCTRFDQPRQSKNQQGMSCSSTLLAFGTCPVDMGLEQL